MMGALWILMVGTSNQSVPEMAIDLCVPYKRCIDLIHEESHGLIQAIC